MKLSHLIAGLTVVAAISAGQILFKLTAVAYENRGAAVPMDAVVLGSVALFIYGLATLGWIWLLRFVPLNAAYPLMALAFIIVPCLSAVFLGEPLTLKTLSGAVLIASGVVLANS